jgi:RimJ/RimL family protein N-acetyltransferase
MIIGQKVALRALETRDAPEFKLWINDPETNFWRGLYHPMSEADAVNWISRESSPDPSRLTLAIEAIDGRFVGVIGLRGICARSRRAEIWIYLGDKGIWRKGFGTDAVAILCDYAFKQLNLHRIWLECDPEHAAAIRCYEKNGFRAEGVLRDGYFRHGNFRDTTIMGRLSTDRK